MQHLFSLNYWFNLRPQPLSSVGQTLFIILLAVFVLTIVGILVANKKLGSYRGLFRRISDFSVGNLIIGLILFFLNYETIPFFSARFWLLIWGIVMIVWAVFIVKFFRKINASRGEGSKAAEFEKYLP
ncbi:MAG: hypothetical protein ACOX0C_00305 [Patescibacteria group bacterium]|jgi:hypothetical protein